MRERMLVGLVALALAATACGGGGENGGVDDGGVAPETGAGGTAGGYYGGGGGGGGETATGATGATGSAADVEASLLDYAFDPDPVEVASGDVVGVTNTSANVAHTFTVPGTDVDLTLGPSESGTVEIALDPGTYDLICRFHEARGMVATLVVS
jgi:plastocyanin